MAFKFGAFGRKKRRAKAMESIARQLQMSYVPKDEYGTQSLLGDFKLFQKGIAKEVRNLLHKKEATENLEISIFDYHYVVPTGNSMVPFAHTVFFIQSKTLALPQFLLKPENFFHKIGTHLGMQDIDFESHPEFSDQYLLKGEDEALIRKKLDDNFRSYFTIEKDWTLEGLGYFMILYRFNKILPTEQLTEFYEKGWKIYNLLKY